MHLVLTADSNCIKLVLPPDANSNLITGFKAGDRIGNLSREISTFLAPLMDSSFGSEEGRDNNVKYVSGFNFTCVLSYENFNHSKAGYEIEIAVHTVNSQSWVDELHEELSKYVQVSLSVL